jgi:hypothetical protein
VTIALERPTESRTRDPKELLNAVAPHVKECTHNIFETGCGVDLHEREVALLMRDNPLTRTEATTILDNGIMYLVTAMERPDVHLGVGKTVDAGVHQIILDTPVYFAFCEVYNGGRYKHHAPTLVRRGDGLVMRTFDVLQAQGFTPDEILWNGDGEDCSPCDDKVPDSH